VTITKDAKPYYSVMPAQAGIQRLKSLDYRIHPCILPLRASLWLFKSAKQI